MFRLADAPPGGAPTIGEVSVLLGGVAFGALTMSSLALALFGVHRGWLAILLAALALVGVVVALVRTTTRRPRFDLTEALIGAVLVGVMAVLVFPGFNYGAKFRDPGVYVGHAFAIEREHATSFPDPVFETDAPVEVRDRLPVLASPTGEVELHCCDTFQSLKADADNEGHILPSFFHAWPALLATTLAVGGRTGLFNTAPVLAILSLSALFLALRRGVSTLTAALGSGLVAVGMMQVWQARYPTTEMATQALFTMGVLAVVVGVRLHSRWALAAAGFVYGSMFLMRPDGLLVVLMLCGAVAFLYGTERAEWSIAPLLAGLAVVVPLAAFQAYDRSAVYTAGKIPSGPLVLALLLGLALVALAVRRLRRRRPAIDAWIERRRPEDWARLAAVVSAVALGLFFVLAALRPALFGETRGTGRSGEVVRKYDEDNLLRLTWFLTPAVIALAPFGVAVLMTRRRAVALYGLLVPGLLLTPILVWNPRISPQLMWWTRRYVPVVLVFLLVAAAAALAWLLTRRGRGRLVTGGVAVALVAWIGLVGLSQSLELRNHDELGGSLALIDRLAATAEGEPVVYLWVDPDENARRYVATMTTHYGQPSLAVEAVTPATVEAVADAYPGREVLVVASRPEVPDLPLAASSRVEGTVERWEDTIDERPDEALERLVQFWVFRP